MNLRDTIATARIGGPVANEDGSTTFEFRFPPNTPMFAGHFPGHPLLPGIVQLEMARLSAESVLNRPLAVRAVSKAKFLRPILPEQLVRLTLKLLDQGGTIQVRATLMVEGQRVGEAILLLCSDDSHSG